MFTCPELVVGHTKSKAVFYALLMLCVISSLVRSSPHSHSALLVYELSKHDSLLLAWTFSLPTNTLHCHLQVNLREAWADPNHWHLLVKQKTPVFSSVIQELIYMYLCVCQRETRTAGHQEVPSHPTWLFILYSDIIFNWTGTSFIYLCSCTVLSWISS